MIELIIAMVVMVIVASYTFISITPYRGVKLDAAAKKVAFDLSYARNMALVMTEWYGVTFEAAPNNSYTIYKTDGTTDSIIADPAGGPFSVNLARIFNGVEISAVNIVGGKKVEFDPLGAPYVDKGGAAVSPEAAITLSYQGRSKSIYITPGTGRIHN